MALSGFSKITPQPGPSSTRDGGAKRCGHRGAAAGAKFYPNDFGPCQIIAKKAAVAVQYPPRWSEATPVATVHASKPRAMWKGGCGGWEVAMAVFVFGSGIHSCTCTQIGAPANGGVHDCALRHTCGQTKRDKLILRGNALMHAHTCRREWLKDQMTAEPFCSSCFYAFILHKAGWKWMWFWGRKSAQARSTHSQAMHGVSLH